MSQAKKQGFDSPPVKLSEPRSARRKSLESGYSLLARAEPQVWFTGGMLVVCIGMIASLLALIIASGLPTFWPRAIDWLVLKDGSLEIGQLQHTQTLDNQNQEAIEPKRYFRTANFDLTDRHYRWTEPQQLSDQGMLRCSQVVLLERLEWGQLYGIPLELIETLEPQSNEQSQNLAQLADVFQAIKNSSANDDQDFAAKIDQAQQAISSVANLQRDSALRKLLKENQIDDGSHLKFRETSQGGNWKAVSDLGETAVASVARQSNEFSVMLARLEKLLPELRHKHREYSRLKSQISRLDSRINSLRVAARQAELDTATVLPVDLASSHYLLEQLQNLQELESSVTNIQPKLKGSLTNNAQAENANNALAEFLKKLPTMRATFEQQQADWLKPVESAPTQIQKAVQAYASGYRTIVANKRPLERRLKELQAELGRSELIVAVPTGSRTLDVPEQDRSELDAGKLNAAVAQQLKALGVNVAEQATAQTIADNQTCKLIEFNDQQQTQHLISLTTPAYLTENAAVVQLIGTKAIACEQIVRVVPVNALGFGGKMNVYLSRWREFLFDDPREANTEGGVFPAIWGTIVMTLIMTIAVVPFGVMAALYLREYTRGGPIVSLIRISINNLAGVPSIVYGVFGFSFFCMTVGSYIDGGPRNADFEVWPSNKWMLALGVTAVLGTSAFLLSLASGGPSYSRTNFKLWAGRCGLVFWLATIIGFVLILTKTPHFHGFYAARLPNPTFGQGGLLWASLTLALLTLPVVIVSTEEALAAVPNSLREGSLACGASKWQTIYRIVLPHARPGILTGAILAMARGAGEVAPLMLVGALPNAPELPLDGEFPFFHGSRSFMHLGYQIFSLGFQSQNSDAARPMVFTCTFLLILIVAALNLSAVFLRARLRRRFQGDKF